MNGIRGLGSLGTQQLRALNRLRQLGQAIAENTTRLSTLKRINSAKDDPSGLIQATLLKRELDATELATRGITRAHAVLDTASAATDEILTQLGNARLLAFEVASGTLSPAEITSRQIEIDTIIQAIGDRARTSFGGIRLLDGTSGFRASGIDTTRIRDIDVLDKRTADDVVIEMDVLSQATQATDRYTGGTLNNAATVTITGPEGSATISLASNSNAQNITDAFNEVAHLTGVNATRVDGNQVDFRTAKYGSQASISIQAIQGTFNTVGGGQTQGADAVAVINGQQYTADAWTLNVQNAQVSMVVRLASSSPTGAVAPFTISGEGLNFVIGSSPTDSARIGLPNLSPARLGGMDGRLSSVVSGGENTLTGGKAIEAVRIIDAAIDDVLRSQAAIGAFQKYTLDGSRRVLETKLEKLSEALSLVQDTDVALESARLMNNRLLEQSTMDILSVINLRNQDVLGLLRTSLLRF